MNKDKLLLLSASLVTLMLGPGTGHLVIKQWKRAILFIAVSFLLMLILAATFVSSVGRETVETVANFQNIEQFKNIFYKFKETNFANMFIFNILFAALWAYSVVDLFKIIKNKNVLKKEEL